MTTETVSGRTQPRYHGPPVTHDVRFTDPGHPIPGYRPGAQTAECRPCGWHTVIDGGHTDDDRARLARQHAGTEDEDP